MNRRGIPLLLVLLASLLFRPDSAEAWGWRGHREICVAATRLVGSPELKAFLVFRADMIGVLCNIPDIRWKDLGPEIRRVGDPTHFLDFEKLGVPRIEDVPTDVGEFLELGSKAGLTNVAEEVGTLWWRADQFVREAVRAGEAMLAADLPTAEQRQDMTAPFNKAAYDMLTYMGILGHFVGDVSMPYHSTVDHDGYASDHGGIHFYYEELAVNALSLELTAEIAEQARDSLRKPKADLDVVAFMKELSIRALQEIPQIERWDPIRKPSQLTPKKIRAERDDPTAGTFGELIVREMAWAAAALAEMWDTIYFRATAKAGEEAKNPLRLWAYRSYANFSVCEFAPDFVPPDYIPGNTVPGRK